VTLTFTPPAVSSSIAAMPGSVAGTLIITFVASSRRHRPSACPTLAWLS
jgi:hypothetical protein